MDFPPSDLRRSAPRGTLGGAPARDLDRKMREAPDAQNEVPIIAGVARPVRLDGEDRAEMARSEAPEMQVDEAVAPALDGSRAAPA